MTITTAGWITITIGFALLIFTLIKGLRGGIKENLTELKRLESAGFASTYTAAPRKQSVYSGPIKKGAKGKHAPPSRSARQMLKEVEDDIREENIALRKDNTIDAVLDPLRERSKQVAGDTFSAKHIGTSILDDDEVKEIRTSTGTDVLFSVEYSESNEDQTAKEQEQKKPRTDILNGTDVLSEGTDVLTEKTDVLQNGTGVLSLNKKETKGTDVLPKGETEPLVSYKKRYIKSLKETEESPEAESETDILVTGTDVLEKSVEAAIEKTPSGTDILPEEKDALLEGTDILDELEEGCEK